jgi:azurin
MRSRFLRFATTAALVLTAAAVFAAAPRVVKIGGTDQMQYTVTKIEAKAGETIKVTLSTTSAMAKAEMAHNFVLLKKGTNVDAFAMAASMARKTNYIPEAKKAEILASTPLAGAGETVEVTFTVPKEAGEYTYICTFPGHFVAGMRGVLIVK